MGRRESYIESEVSKEAHRRGWRVRKMQYVGRRGCPDRFYFRNGEIVMIEFKDVNGHLSPLQRKEINWLTENGFYVKVVDSIEGGVEIFESLDGKDSS